mgnify:CR=1 FL=1
MTGVKTEKKEVYHDTAKRLRIYPKTDEMLKEIVMKRRKKEAKELGAGETVSQMYSPTIKHIHEIIEKVYLEEVKGV